MEKERVIMRSKKQEKRNLNLEFEFWAKEYENAFSQNDMLSRKEATEMLLSILKECYQKSIGLKIELTDDNRLAYKRLAMLRQEETAKVFYTIKATSDIDRKLVKEVRTNPDYWKSLLKEFE